MKSHKDLEVWRASVDLARDIYELTRAYPFSARFGRLQDTVMDKVLPRLLLAGGENAGSAIDNLNHADRLGLVDRPGVPQRV